MSRTVRAWTTMVVLAMTAVVGVPHAAGAPAGGEGAVVTMVNDARAGQGLAALADNETLRAIAGSHSERMAQAGSIFHNSGLPDEVSSSGMRWSVVGENVGLGADVEHVEHAFIASPEHYANIMDARFTAIGVASPPMATDTSS